MVCDNISHCSDGQDEDTYLCDRGVNKTFKYTKCFHSQTKRNCYLNYNFLHEPYFSKDQLVKNLDACTKTVCLLGEYQCQYHRYCIKIDQYCDGINDCLLGDDEAFCGIQTILI